MVKTSFLLMWRQKIDVLSNGVFILLSWLFVAFLGHQSGFSTSAQGLTPFDLISFDQDLPTSSLGVFFWVIFLFSVTLSTTGAFKDDFDDGTLSLLKTEPGVIEVFLLTRVIMLFCFNSLNALVSLSVIYGFTGVFFGTLLLKIFLLLPGLLCLFLLVQMLCLSYKNASQILPLLVWPLAIPLFLFASASSHLSSLEGAALTATPLWLLGALSFFFAPLCFWGMRFSFRFL